MPCAEHAVHDPLREPLSELLRGTFLTRNIARTEKCTLKRCHVPRMHRFPARATNADTNARSSAGVYPQPSMILQFDAIFSRTLQAQDRRFHFSANQSFQLPFCAHRASAFPHELTVLNRYAHLHVNVLLLLLIPRAVHRQEQSPTRHEYHPAGHAPKNLSLIHI